MKRLEYLIIGSGPAGIFAAEAIRPRDSEGTITMVSEDENPALSPVMLTYWIAGHLSEEGLLFRDPSWAEMRRIDLWLGRKVVSLDGVARKVKLSDGDEISYERLLIATGASPISLPIPGKESRGVASLRNRRDAEMIFQGERDLREVVIIGGGFIGLKLACHLKERGLRVTVLEKERKLAARIFDLRASRLVEERLRQEGVGIETDVEVVEILNQKGWVSGVRLRDGRIFPCQRVIEAVGVRPNIQFLANSGVDFREGVLVDERMETNVSGVYAAGDVALTIDPITSERVNHATWSAAARQGRVAGSNMAGGDQRCLQNFNLNAISLFGLQVMAAGHPYVEGQADIDGLVDETRESYRKMVIREGSLIGFILVGDVSGAGFLLSLMKRGVELSPNEWGRLLSSRTFRHDLPPHLGFDHGFLFERAGGNWRSL
ncbi:MAG: NAD(P)/FAD-dependent oxidoreductase [Syntrophaceae bacterium]|nr:NAD(P)/FAD-dependent oxidoreductase [Syntrophaceae bacterium]